MLSRIEDVQHADALTQNPSLGDMKTNSLKDSVKILTSGKFPDAVEEIES